MGAAASLMAANVAEGKYHGMMASNRLLTEEC
jgi:hypothetical protein